MVEALVAIHHQAPKPPNVDPLGWLNHHSKAWECGFTSSKHLQANHGLFAFCDMEKNLPFARQWMPMESDRLAEYETKSPGSPEGTKDWEEKRLHRGVNASKNPSKTHLLSCWYIRILGIGWVSNLHEVGVFFPKLNSIGILSSCFW